MASRSVLTCDKCGAEIMRDVHGPAWWSINVQDENRPAGGRNIDLCVQCQGNTTVTEARSLGAAKRTKA